MLDIYGERFKSRLLLGTAQYPSPATLRQAVEASSAEIVTVSLRRESARMRAGQGFLELIEDLGVRVPAVIFGLGLGFDRALAVLASDPHPHRGGTRDQGSVRDVTVRVGGGGHRCRGE